MIKAILIIIGVVSLMGCETALRDLHGIDFRTTQEIFDVHKEKCTLTGFKASTPQFIECVYTLEKLRLGQKGTGTSSPGQQQHQQEHINRQILNHGMGGCTPDFSTGGCLD